MSPSRLALDNWPPELFGYLVTFLDPSDVLCLKGVTKPFKALAGDHATWRAFALRLVALRPLPIEVPGLTLSTLLTNAEYTPTLIKTVVTAHRVHLNWSDYSSPILRKLIVFHPGAGKRWLDMSVLVLPGSRYLISTEYNEEEGVNELLISDVQLACVLARWEYESSVEMLTWRPVDDGRGIVFLVSRARGRGDVEYTLLRFDVPCNSFGIVGSFVMPLKPLVDLTLSEELILMMDLEPMDGSVSFDVRNWRTNSVGRVRTGVITDPSKCRVNILSPDLALSLQSPIPEIYTFPLSSLPPSYTSFIPIQLPLTAPYPLIFTEHDPLSLRNTYTERVTSSPARLWDTASTTRSGGVTGRDMVVCQFFRNPKTAGNAYTEVQLAIAHYILPVPFTGAPMRRTWLGPINVMLASDHVALLEFQAKHGIFVTPNPPRLQLLTLPPWGVEGGGELKTLPIPETVDLTQIKNISLDEPSGIVGLTFGDGGVWLFYFDGFADGIGNVAPEVLEAEILARHEVEAMEVDGEGEGVSFDDK